MNIDLLDHLHQNQEILLTINSELTMYVHICCIVGYLCYMWVTWSSGHMLQGAMSTWVICTSTKTLLHHLQVFSRCFWNQTKVL